MASYIITGKDELFGLSEYNSETQKTGKHVVHIGQFHDTPSSYLYHSAITLFMTSPHFKSGDHLYYSNAVKDKLFFTKA